jgi:hypothetical protein
MVLIRYVLHAVLTATVILFATEVSMDKGIELLIERRKMYPEEFKEDGFKEIGRWVDFLRLWRVDLDDPDSFPSPALCNSEHFHDAVMRKLLEGDRPSYTASLAKAMMETKGRIEEALFKDLYK